jgi:hypothetical protein
MVRPVDLLRQGRKGELWQMCCGYIDLSLDQFVHIQHRLLLEQMELLKDCQLGQRVMHRAMPETVDDFRNQVPFTSYADYCPELHERHEHTLPAKPAYWVRTSGYSGTYDIKWVPWSEGFAAECEKVCGACAIFSQARHHGDLARMKPHLKILYTVGGLEYATGALGHLMQRAIDFDYLPSSTDGMTFVESIKAGFAQALYQGLDGFGGLPSVLVTVGEQMKAQQTKPDMAFLRSHPAAMLRLLKGVAKSKLAKRQLLPKDLWDLTGVLGGGTDSAVFKNRVEEMWGRRPLEMYGGTEGGLYATQLWDYEGLTFVPTLNFFEFIPEEELRKGQADLSYQPKTVLMDGVEPGQNYEMVITNLHGGSLVRFRVGDMIRITSMRNDNLGVNLPQMAFYGRADYLIDIAGLGRLTERIIWEAIEATGVPYVDWTARKEVREDRAVLHIYLEPRCIDGITEKGLALAVGRELERLDAQYHHNPYNIYDGPDSAQSRVEADHFIEVSLLPQGVFANYVLERQAEGADLGHLKPSHINPSDKVLTRLSVEAVPSPEAVAAAR